jgi:ribosomal protein S18 acetylase RimI-like enzyme
MELADRGHAGMADRYRLGAEVDGGESAETTDGVLYAGRSEFPVMLNGAIPLGGDPNALAQAARSYFADRRRGFSFFSRAEAEDDAADRAGLHPLIERYPAMVLREPLEALRVPEGASLRRVGDATTAAAYWRLADAAFVAIGMPAGILGAFPPEALLDRDDTVAFVAYLGDRPVAAASVVLARGIGGIQWVGVLEEARGRGLAALCTGAAANAGFEDLGADCAWLEASHMGEPVYRKMGFEELYSYKIYVAPPPA